MSTFEVSHRLGQTSASSWPGYDRRESSSSGLCLSFPPKARSHEKSKMEALWESGGGSPAKIHRLYPGRDLNNSHTSEYHSMEPHEGRPRIRSQHPTKGMQHLTGTKRQFCMMQVQASRVRPLRPFSVPILVHVSIHTHV